MPLWLDSSSLDWVTLNLVLDDICTCRVKLDNAIKSLKKQQKQA